MAYILIKQRHGRVLCILNSKENKDLEINSIQQN